MNSGESKQSAYMLIFRDTAARAYEGMSPEQRQTLLQRWNDWYDGLVSAGKVSHGHPLEPEGRVVSNGRVTDGPYAEGKEAVGGFFFLTVASMDEAIAIAKMCPSLPYGLTVEVRQVAEICPVLKAHQQQQRELAEV